MASLALSDPLSSLSSKLCPSCRTVGLPAFPAGCGSPAWGFHYQEASFSSSTGSPGWGKGLPQMGGACHVPSGPAQQILKVSHDQSLAKEGQDSLKPVDALPEPAKGASGPTWLHLGLPAPIVWPVQGYIFTCYSFHAMLVKPNALFLLAVGAPFSSWHCLRGSWHSLCQHSRLCTIA